jgi:HlyD family secretion protein
MPLSPPPPALRSLKPNQLLPPVGQWIILGGLILSGAIGIAVILAAVLKYNTSIVTTARVRPVGELRLVQTAAAGKVVAIEVQVNQLVRQGDIIARLDATSLETQKQQLETTLQQQQVQLNYLNEQIQWINTKLAAETNSTQQLESIAAAEFVNEQRRYQDQQVISRSELTEAEAALTLASRELQRYQQLAEGAVSQLQIEEKQAAVRIAEQRVLRAQTALNPSTAPLTIAQQRTAQVQSIGQSTLATLQQEQATLQQQQSDLRSQQAQTQENLRQLQISLNQTLIRAPGNGIILRLMLRNVHQVVQAGETLAEIAPDDTLHLRATVSPQEMGRVQLGQHVQMRVSACPYPDYGLLQGEVTAISPDVIPVDSQSGASQGNAFEVMIRPATDELVQGDRRCAIQSGMEAEATIVAQEETFLRFLLRKARVSTGF